MKISRRDALSMLAAAAVAAPVCGAASSKEVPVSSQEVQKRREALYRLLAIPDRARPVSGRTVSEREQDGYVLERLELDLNGLEPVPAFFVRPRQLSGRVPAVLYNHSHGGGYTIGKRELVEGREYLSTPPYGKVLTDLGCAALCIDCWVFGERSHTSESDMFKAMLWNGQVLWGMMVYDSLKALDYLLTRPEVDPDRIATLGMSMGSTMAWWLAALDERIGVTVDICCLTDFQALLERKALSEHGLYYYVPGLLREFTTAGINALIAPRPHLAIAGNLDSLTPPEGLDRIDRELKEVYSRLGAPQNWRLLRYEAGHQETAEAREEVVAFLRQHLLRK